MNLEFFPIIIVFLLNLIFYYSHEKIASFLNIYDYPDEIRKKHSKPIPLLGGIYLIFNILIIYIINFIDKNIDINFLFFFSILIFALGILDDKFDLKVRLKFFLLFTIIFCLVSINENILINNLYFETFQTTIFLGKYSTFFTVLCFLLFLNACNMFDGINLQLGIYSLQVFIFFIFNNIFFSFSILIIMFIFLFLKLNKNNLSFFGDSGSLLISFLIAYMLIAQYNSAYTKLSCEMIFIIMFLPGLDMFRLFLMRLYKKKNPFKPDTNHIHHLINKKYSFFMTISIVQLLIFLGLALSYFLKLYLIILIMFMIYVVLISYMQIKNQIKN